MFYCAALTTSRKICKDFRPRSIRAASLCLCHETTVAKATKDGGTRSALNLSPGHWAVMNSPDLAALLLSVGTPSLIEMPVSLGGRDVHRDVAAQRTYYYPLPDPFLTLGIMRITAAPHFAAKEVPGICQ